MFIVKLVVAAVRRKSLRSRVVSRPSTHPAVALILDQPEMGVRPLVVNTSPPSMRGRLAMMLSAKLNHESKHS
jgi:hypothetical protein